MNSKDNRNIFWFNLKPCTTERFDFCLSHLLYNLSILYSTIYYNYWHQNHSHTTEQKTKTRNPFYIKKYAKIGVEIVQIITIRPMIIS